VDFNLGEYFPDTESLNKPSDLEFIYYIFWEKGISQDEFNKLELPYIFSMANAARYIKEKEQKEIEKSKHV
jgi:hypothetical protein